MAAQATDIGALNASFGRAGAVQFEVSPLGGTVARLRAGRHDAVVALQGAQVLSWTCAGRELLWLSPVSRLGTAKAVRGGIPVCWPWFGPHPSDSTKPAHGFVRTAIWEVVESTATPGHGHALVRLRYATTAADKAFWPHDAVVSLTLDLDQLAGALSIALETRNIGTSPFSLTQALHTYFGVSDIADTLLEGLDGCAYIDKLDADIRKTQSGPVVIDREVDRIYQGTTVALALIDRRRQADIRIESTGSRSAVVWNPWDQKTSRLGDMGSPDAFREMLCIETANAGDDVVTVQPGACHTLGARYRLA